MSTSLYEILEIESSATETEIKKAYRKLALRYHPDKVSEEERENAEVKFKEITHAYEILSDETKRGEYDLYGSADGVGGGHDEYSFHGNPFDNFYGNSNEYGADDFYNFFQGMNGGGGHHHGRPNANPRTEDAEINVDVTLEDLFKGKTIRTTSTRNIICKLCKGSGAKPSAISKTCSACEGAGKIHKIQRLGPGMVTQKIVECTTCKGSGKIYRPKDKCKKCQGERVVEETKILEFEIKKGSKSGGTIVLKGESDECPGKETGDVRLTFTCKDHPVFERKGDDLFAKFKIPLAEALCGFSKVVVQHLDGRSIRVTTPKGKVIRPGDFIKIKQEGMPVCSDNKSWFSPGSKRGDLYIEIDIEFPQDNWYLEKNDIFTMKNLLPNTLRNKEDLKKQEVDQDSSPDENIDEFTDFVISTRNALPNYDNQETPQEQDNNDHHDHHHDHYQNGYGAAQPECTPQ